MSTYSTSTLVSTETSAQRVRALQMLRKDERSTFDFRRAGIMQSGTRIFELRAMGYDIRTVARRDMYDSEGTLHRRVAVYRLCGEPTDAGSRIAE